MTAPRRILLTGGAGTIATGFAAWSAGRYDIELLDLPGRFGSEHHGLGATHEADLGDLPALKEAFAGIHTVVHLGGERSPSAVWERLLPTNVVGTYNVVAAAIAAGCAHVVYASSVHAVSGDPARWDIDEGEAVRPADLYGVTKCFGEALGSFAAESSDIAFTALRIGAFQEPERLSEDDAGWMLRDYCAPDDLYQLMQRVIDGTPSGYAVYNAVSANTFGRLSVERARRELGYQPAFDAFRLSPTFDDAITTVGGIDDRPALSGLRRDIGVTQEDDGRSE